MYFQEFRLGLWIAQNGEGALCLMKHTRQFLRSLANRMTRLIAHHIAEKRNRMRIGKLLPLSFVALPLRSQRSKSVFLGM